MAAFSEACTITPRKCFAGEGKKDRMLLEKQIILVALFWFWLHIRILVSETITFHIFISFLCLVATFTEKHCTKKWSFLKKNKTADLVTFTEESLNGKLLFLCCDCEGTSRKYFTEQVISFLQWSENHTFLWVHSYVSVLEC